jgi:alkyldihydroxyacetonephosphate synthase
MNDGRFRHKWWGWGPADVTYDMASRTDLWPWIQRVAGISSRATIFDPVDRAELQLPPRCTNREVETVLRPLLAPHQIRTDDEDRLAHAYGRSYRDLVRIRSGSVDSAPDLVVYPETHEDVVTVVDVCQKQGAALIPFGGGTNVVGAVEHRGCEAHVRVTLDLRRMNRLISVDRASMTAEIEAGAFGPQIEEALAQHGLALGHHPDSFVYSTLGGWIATRSAGSHSNAYGKIEDMLVAVRVVTPTGVLETRAYPAASHGPDWNRLIGGSEGALGVITSATLKVHPTPEYEEYRMLLFPSFERGLQAMHECVSEGFMPTVARLSDEMETELIFAAKHPARGWRRWTERGVRRALALKGYVSPAAVVLGFEGPALRTRPVRDAALKICRRLGAFDLGRRPGEAWKRSRYDVPYLRDYMMDYALLADAFETATVWSHVPALYRDSRRAILDAFLRETGHDGYLGCHISHLYNTGACLYFTVGVQAREGATPPEMNEQYTAIKASASEAFVRNGGTLSHHHGVGYEHEPWMDRDHSEPALRGFDQLKDALDPKGIMSPGNLRRSSPSQTV